MKKICLLAAVALAVNMGITSVNAHDAFFEGKYVNIQTVEFSVDGEKITSLPSEGEVLVTVPVKKSREADDMQKVSIVAAVYDDYKLIRVKSQEYILENNYTDKISVSVDVADASRLNVFVCDDLENGCPFAAKSIFSEKESKIKSIYVAGKEIEGFSEDTTDYNVTVSAALLSFPEITVKSTDSGAKCEISTKGSFPLENKERATATVTVTKKSGEKKIYNIVLTQEQPEITDLVVINEVRATGEIADELANVVTQIQDVSFKNEPEEPIKISTNSATGEDMTDGYGYSNMSGTAMFNDRGAYPMAFVPSQLKNAYMIQTKMNFNTGAGSYVTFDINRSATVYVSATAGAELISQGYSLVEGMNVSWINCNADQGRLYKYPVYKKHYDVSEGEVTNVYVPHGGITPFVVFDESKVVSNAILKPTKGNEMALPIIDVKNAEYADKKDPSYKEGIGNYIYATKVIADMMNETYYFADEFPEEVLGSYLIAAPDKIRKYTQNVTSADFIRFDLSQSADVYVVYESSYDRIPWMAKEGFEDVSDSFGSIKYVYDEEDGTEYSTHAYKKSYSLTPGETVRVNIGGFPTTENSSKIPLMIFVKKAND